MPTAVWPTTLPQELLQDNYSEQAQDNRIVYQPDVGPAIMRKRYTAVPTAVTGRMVLTSAQKAALATFYATTLEGGSLPFDWHIPGDAAAACTMQFMAPPRYSVASGDYFHADMSLEILP